MKSMSKSHDKSFEAGWRRGRNNLREQLRAMLKYQQTGLVTVADVQAVIDNSIRADRLTEAE